MEKETETQASPQAPKQVKGKTGIGLHKSWFLH